jgi:hypothetical protein
MFWAIGIVVVLFVILFALLLALDIDFMAAGVLAAAVIIAVCAAVVWIFGGVQMALHPVDTVRRSDLTPLLVGLAMVAAAAYAARRIVLARRARRQKS